MSNYIYSIKSNLLSNQDQTELTFKIQSSQYEDEIKIFKEKSKENTTPENDSYIRLLSW